MIVEQTTGLRFGTKGAFLLVNDVMAGQTPAVIGVFSKFIQEFDTIVEVGTGRGAFALWISLNKKPDATFVTFDVKPHLMPDLSRATVVQSNVFDTQTFSEVTVLMQRPGRLLFLCDGGDKEKELAHFAPFLKSGDVIMAHDYAHSPEDYAKIQRALGWPTAAETRRWALPTLLETNQLVDYKHYEQLKNVLWGSWQKQ